MVCGDIAESEAFKQFAACKLDLGTDAAMDFGNLYTAALPAWLAAGFADALARGEELAGQTMLAIGYGSGDAAEAWPLEVVDGWQRQAARIGIDRALAGAHDLTREQYERLHDEGELSLMAEPSGFFAIERVGQRHEPAFQDLVRRRSGRHSGDDVSRGRAQRPRDRS